LVDLRAARRAKRGNRRRTHRAGNAILRMAARRWPGGCGADLRPQYVGGRSPRRVGAGRRSGKVGLRVPYGLASAQGLFAPQLVPDSQSKRSARGARFPACIHMFAASRGFGAGAGDPFGRSNMPLGRRSKKASTSDVFTTSAYLAFMSQRLMAWLACERSKEAFSASAMRHVRLK